MKLDLEKESVGSTIKSYLETRIEIERLVLLRYAVRLISSAATKLVLFQLAIFSVFFLSFAAEAWLRELTGKPVYSFGILGFFFLVSAVIFHLFRRNWQRKTENSFVKKLLNHEGD